MSYEGRLSFRSRFRSHQLPNYRITQFTMSVSRAVWSRTTWLWWAGIVGGVGFVLALAWLPPVVSPEVRAVLMQAFAPLCHQMPARSPHVDGVALAVCDRCMGIYGGLVLGMGLAASVRLLATWAMPTRVSDGTLARSATTVLLGALVPIGVDWLGPMISAWTPLAGWGNTPLSRALTGALLGAAGGALLMFSIAKNASDEDEQETEDEAKRKSSRET